MVFYKHPFVVEKRCVRKPGVGFEYKGRRLMGITEFLRRSYYPQFTACRRGKKGAGKPSSKKHRNLGMKMGSIADHAITDYVKTGSVRKMAACPTARRLAAFLHQNKLRIVDAHVLVCEPNYGIATEIDVLCHGAKGLVVIENKTTLQTKAEHCFSYKQADRNNPLLLRGLRSLVNSEYIHHQLQLAAMLIMLRNTYNVRATGHVVVATTDGISHYPMDQQILNLLATSLCSMHYFTGPKNKIASAPLHPSVKYSLRPFLQACDEPPLDALPPLVAKFLAKKDAKLTSLNHSVGTLSFYERPDIVLPVVVDIFAESPTTLYLFTVKHSNLDSKTCSSTDSAPVKAAKLPTGHSNSFLNTCCLELATKLHALSSSTNANQKKIELRVVVLSSAPRPFMRVVPPSFRSALK